MSRDIQILPDRQGAIEFTVQGASDDTGLMLLQRLYTLMFCDQDSPYRSTESAYALLKFLEGGNRPVDGVMNAMLSVCCAVTLTMLDDADRDLVDEFYAVSNDGVVECTLKLKDGTTINGVLDV